MTAPAETVAMLLRSTPEDAADFAAKTQVVRAAILASGADALVTPERGAMPIYWAAEGLPGVDKNFATEVIRPPIGTHFSQHPQVGTSGLNKPQKQHALERSIGELKDEDIKFVLLDEVQNGGTIYAAAHFLAGIVKNSSKNLNVISAQDTRINRTTGMARGYRTLASNRNVQVATTTVQPMPLIATDRDPLLNTLVRTDTGPFDSLDVTLEVRNNLCAEMIFRTLGSIAANHRDDDRRELLLQQLMISGASDTSKEHEIDDWVSRTTSALKHFTDQSRA
ncbi:MAG TPA: hypothetical protein VGE34_01290 [Candidatus Saccharimonadales bacterium]